MNAEPAESEDPGKYTWTAEDVVVGGKPAPTSK